MSLARLVESAGLTPVEALCLFVVVAAVYRHHHGARLPAGGRGMALAGDAEGGRGGVECPACGTEFRYCPDCVSTLEG